MRRDAIHDPAGGLAPPLGFLVPTWPKLSETFILEEVLALERRGVALQIYALAGPSDGVAHAAVARVRSPVTRLAAASDSRDSWAALGALALRAPQRVARALAIVARRGVTGWHDLPQAIELARHLHAHGVAHLHVHFISHAADVAQLAACLAGVPFSISAHAKDIYLGAPRDLARKLMASRFTVTCTQANVEALTAAAPDATIERMYHGIDHTVFHPGRRMHLAGETVRTGEKRRVAEEPRLLAVGRLREKKGLDVLIDACRLMHERGRRVRCDIVGYGPEHDALARRIESAGLGRHVHLVGKLTREALLDRYAAASVFVQPSRVAADGDRDGIPNVMLEAMAMALPVVATRVSGIPEVIEHERQGLLVEPDAPLALADAIERLLLDEALARRVAGLARAAIVEHFDNDRNLRVLTRLLEPTHGCACQSPALARVDA